MKDHENLVKPSQYSNLVWVFSSKANSWVPSFDISFNEYHLKIDWTDEFTSNETTPDQISQKTSNFNSDLPSPKRSIDHNLLRWINTQITEHSLAN